MICNLRKDSEVKGWSDKDRWTCNLKTRKGWEYSSLVEHLTNKQEALSSRPAPPNNKQKQNILNKDEGEDDSDNLIASITQITKQSQSLKQKQSSSNILDENSSDDEINLQVPNKAPTISSEAERIVLDESLTSSNAKTTKKNNS